jgi:hypothetical protein
MNNRATRALVIAIALVSPTASHAQPSEGPAVVKARELVAAINGGNDALRQFVTDTFSKSFLDFAPVDMHLKVLGGLRSGGDVTVETGRRSPDPSVDSFCEGADWVSRCPCGSPSILRRHTGFGRLASAPRQRLPSYR